MIERRRLNKSDSEAIWRQLDDGVKQKVIAIDFGVSPATICRINKARKPPPAVAEAIPVRCAPIVVPQPPPAPRPATKGGFSMLAMRGQDPYRGVHERQALEGRRGKLSLT